jgi:hypothetical protein
LSRRTKLHRELDHMQLGLVTYNLA